MKKLLILPFLISSVALCMDKERLQLGFSCMNPEVKEVYLSVVEGRPKPTSENISIFEDIAKNCCDLRAQIYVILGIYYLTNNLPKAKSVLSKGLRSEKGKGCAYYLTRDGRVRGSDIKKSIEIITEIIKNKNVFDMR